MPQPAERDVPRRAVRPQPGAVPFPAPPVVLVEHRAGRGGEQQSRGSERVLGKVQPQFGGG